jgi:hypothetical protein
MRQYKNSKFSKIIVHLLDPRLVVLKGVVAARAIDYLEVKTWCTCQHYVISTPRFFINSKDPEKYRIKGLDGFDQCAYTYKSVISKRQQLQIEEIFKIPTTKLAPLGTPLTFEDTVFTCYKDDCLKYLKDRGELTELLFWDKEF